MMDRLVSSDTLRRSSPVLVVVLVIASGALFGIEIAFLVLAGSALAAVIALLWSSVQSLTGESPLTFEEALSMGAPSAEEEQKRAVLRALKDLEYERSVGKITAEDYKLYSARYRAEAKRLMQAVDESLSPARQQVEALLRERLAKPEAKAPESKRAEDDGDEPSEAAGDDAEPHSVPAPDSGDETKKVSSKAEDPV